MQKPVVMLIWSHGCKAIEDFVLIFASFLHHVGFIVQLDLLENNAIAELGGIANYLINREDAADFVVIVCAGGEGKSTLQTLNISFILYRICFPKAFSFQTINLYYFDGQQ